MGIIDKIQSMFRSDKLDVEKRFELLREAISGTMSKFYMARDRASGQIVGLKIGDRKTIEQFESRFKGLNKPSEGDIATQLKHPRIVETLEHGVTSDGLPYLVMEFLSGPGLHYLVQNRDLILVGKRLGLVRQMAEAVGYLHKSGYIHRDICPRNFICSDDATSLKLIDFGLTLPATKPFMQPGNRTGTPFYMAPEVVRRRWTDQRLDMFSFGVTAFEVCTNERPWDYGGKSQGIVALSHDTRPPKQIQSVYPKLDKFLGDAIMKCLSSDPKNRPETAEVFLRLIKGVEADEAPADERLGNAPIQ